MKRFVHDPDAILPYYVNWASDDGTNDGGDSDTGWLQGDTIATSTWAADSDNITIETSSKTNTVATVWISGGVVGQRYELTNHIVTAAGLEEDHTIQLICKEK